MENIQIEQIFIKKDIYIERLIYIKNIQSEGQIYREIYIQRRYIYKRDIYLEKTYI